MTAFLAVAPYNMVEVHRPSKGVCCLHHQGTEDSAPVETEHGYVP
jgi:hypothetical protein